MGGTWFSTEYMRNLADEISRYSIGVTPVPEPQHYAWSERRTGFPVPLTGGHLVERALYEFGTVMRRTPLRLPDLPAEDLADIDISVAEWIEQQKVPKDTADFLSGWASLYTGAPLEEVSLLQFSYSCAAPFDKSAYMLFTGLAEKFTHGTIDLATALLEDARVTLKLNTRVTRIEQTGDLVTVTTAHGERLTADSAVIAVPINVLDTLEFGWQLDPAITAIAAAKQPCRSLKVWALVSNAPRGLFSVGYGDTVGLNWVSHEYSIYEGELYVAFGFDPEKLDISDPKSVERAIRMYVPDAVVHEVDSDPWNDDPYSAGTWGMWRPGWLSQARMAAFQQLHGRLAPKVVP
jgi:Flavin containing amine oxidoreductase